MTEWKRRPSGLAVPHHSASDWDFSCTWGLDNSIYVIPPASLRVTTTNDAIARLPVLCRKADTLNLPQGRIETQWRNSYTGYALNAIYFRQQSTLGAFDTNNTYMFWVASDRCYAAKRVAGTPTTFGSFQYDSHAINTWYRERWTWWKEAGALAMRYEYWNGSQWVTVTPDIYDSSPSFEGSGTNRCGVGVNAMGGGGSQSHNLWFDSTLIEWPS